MSIHNIDTTPLSLNEKTKQTVHRQSGSIAASGAYRRLVEGVLLEAAGHSTRRRPVTSPGRACMHGKIIDMDEQDNDSRQWLAILLLAIATMIEGVGHLLGIWS